MALKGPRTGSYTNAVNSRYNFNRLPVADFVTAQTPAGPDEYFKNTTLLLSTSVTNGAQNNTFLDSSNNNFTITRNGNATQGSFSPHSLTGWSNYFDGTGDYLTVADDTSLDAFSDFTIECWAYWSSTAGTFQVILDKGWNNGSYGAYLLTLVSGDLKFYAGSTGSSWDVANAVSLITPTTNQWYHIAITRSGSSGRCFINGTEVTTFTSSATLLNSSVGLGIGAAFGGAYPINGYISNLRVIKGAAQYTAAFTPPTSPLTAIANTSLLTCQSNRFIDNSTNNFTITRNGDVSIQPFAPFNPTEEYSTTTVGGSGYFDGTGDYLSVPNDTNFEFGSGNFTIEFWVNPKSNPSETLPLARTYDGSGYSFAAYFTSGTVNFLYNNLTQIAGTATLSLNTWNHIAYVRNSNTLTIYVNGVSSGSGSISGALTSSSRVTSIGAREDGNFPFTGYISNLRVTKGTAVYTGNFTPPTAPILVSGSSTPYTNTSNVNTTFAAANTSLLCNFTNAGIFDATARNILETVGNAQASQTQTKFGASSMYFDGTDDRLFAPSSVINTLNGDFTFEAWIYRATTGADHSIIGIGDYIGSTGIVFYVTSTATLGIYSGSGLMSGGTIPTNTWTHVALVRSGTSSGNLKLYVNGSSVGTPATSTSTFTGALYVGTGLYNGGLYNNWNGYLDDVRITKYARYTTNFTPPTTTFSLR